MIILKKIIEFFIELNEKVQYFYKKYSKGFGRNSPFFNEKFEKYLLYGRIIKQLLLATMLRQTERHCIDTNRVFRFL